MSIQWFNETPKAAVATLTSANITFNKTATYYFETAYQVMMGFDKDKSIIVVKPLSKAVALRGDIPEQSRYNITVKSSYSRVTNKAFIQTISEQFELTFAETGNKYSSTWDEKNNFLVINLKEEII
ncbi:Conserved hypothetical protein [Alteracholeplasma palmae J233]|uniref:Uncharacterized protein n=1 Tax=Alteracholeplasma palmae (strain ATCC 49389 / J233) TaxID=1318466 RepID=U4KKQ3_ALTPJ|nr:hypothetical protein [Alteracholeplasma palmae]CCV64359.1 Conserved hypothetical protein [Alteracholeplasma palmae J233]